VAAGIAFEVVPGITSAIAAPAYAGIPVTHRAQNSHLTIFTGHEDPAKSESALNFEALAQLGGTQVMLMGMDKLAAITGEMLAHGARRNLPVALIRLGTSEQQRTIVGTLEDIAERATATGLEAPAVAIFGDVVRAAKEFELVRDTSALWEADRGNASAQASWQTELSVA
jgi:uroporphyrinogen III methyltransferase/synthase